MNLAQQGEMGRAGGWLGRARRLVEREGRECVEQGYLLMPLMFQHEASGDLDAAIATAAEAAEIAERFGDADLLVVAVHSQGQLMVSQGRAKEGLALLDDSMLAVTNGELSPIASGIVYCGVILGCQAAFEVRRAQEWTAALAAWCREQPDMVGFTGRCLLHRTEILELSGAWVEARRATRRCLDAQNRRADERDAARHAPRATIRSGYRTETGALCGRLRPGREPRAVRRHSHSAHEDRGRLDRRRADGGRGPAGGRLSARRRPAGGRPAGQPPVAT